MRDTRMSKGFARSLSASARNTVIRGDCVEVMKGIKTASIDFVLTDPPYGVKYRSRNGDSVRNDDCLDWLEPAFREIHRVMKNDTLCLCFYGYTTVAAFTAAWKAAGFRIVGHAVFRKRYASSESFLKQHHEQAYLLAKGRPEWPENPLASVADFFYTGNRLHPTQKPEMMLRPFIDTYCSKAGVVLDPFCGSGSTLVAAKQCGRDYIGIELDSSHHRTASLRLRRFR
ncbi:MAG: DNA methyltransferase [Pseudomonadota bacterium]